MFLDRLLVADEVVVNDEHEPHRLAPQGLELVDDLPGALEAWSAAEGDDDVTELALKRTAARELHAPEEVAIHFEEIVAGERDARHVGALRLLIAGAVPSGPPVGQELGPGRLRLADEDRLHEALEGLLGHRHPRSADNAERAPGPELAEDFPHPVLLDAHPGETDDVGPGEAREVDRLDVLIDESHVVALRREGRQQWQAGDGKVGPFADHREGMLEAPEGGIETGIDEHDVGHGGDQSCGERMRRSAEPAAA